MAKPRIYLSHMKVRTTFAGVHDVDPKDQTWARAKQRTPTTVPYLFAVMLLYFFMFMSVLLAYMCTMCVPGEVRREHQIP